MQKIFRINILSRNQAVRQSRKKFAKKLKQEWQEHDQRALVASQFQNQKIKEERKNRREDWIKGPLAPDRNTGATKGIYGTVNQTITQRPTVPERLQRGPKEDGWESVDTGSGWEGDGQVGNVVVGDRVCVVSGSDAVKGKIGTVNSVSWEREEVTIAGVNMSDVSVPEAAPDVATGGRKFFSVELPVSLHDVRLVYRMTDDATGMDRDVIIRHLRGGAPYLQREYRSNIPRHTRYVVGEDIEIPWPAPDIPDMERTDSDTSRREVEEITYFPSIIEQPLPRGVIDELRPKFSRRRTWHDADWVGQKVIEDARSSWWQSRKLMSPQQEFLEEKTKKTQQERESEAKRMERETIDIISQEMRSSGLTGSATQER